MKNLIHSTTFLAIIACWLWSTAFVGVKIGLEFHTPFQFAGIRFFISGLLIFFYLHKPHIFFSEIKANFKFVVIVSLIQIFATYALFYNGINLVPGALAAMIIGSSPIFVATVAHFSLHNDKMNLHKFISIMIGVAGIIIITVGRTKVELRNELELLGIGLLLINNMLAGYANVLVSKSPKGISPLVLSSGSLIIGGLLLFLVSLPLEGLPSQNFPVKYYIALGWLSFLSAAAISIWFSLLRRPGVKISVLNVWKFLIPVSGAILSWILLENEHPDIPSVIGMLVIAISLIVLNYGIKRSVRKERLASYDGPSKNYPADKL